MEFIDLLIESHIGLERQGPGSREATLKALSFIDASKVKKAADMGCGTGGQTIIIAENISGEIIGVDQFQGFVDVLNSNAAKANLNAKGMVGAMDNLPFAPEEFDLIWSEGAIDAIGFDKGLSHWKEFLKKGGFIAVTCPSWLAAEHPAEIENFWQDAGSKLDTIEHNISVMQASGYAFLFLHLPYRKTAGQTIILLQGTRQRKPCLQSTQVIKWLKISLQAISLRLIYTKNIKSITATSFILAKRYDDLHVLY